MVAISELPTRASEIEDELDAICASLRGGESWDIHRDRAMDLMKALDAQRSLRTYVLPRSGHVALQRREHG